MSLLAHHETAQAVAWWVLAVPPTVIGASVAMQWRSIRRKASRRSRPDPDDC